MRQTFNAARNNSKQTAAEVDAMRAQLEKAQAKVKEAEQARDKAELKNKAQIQLQQDKRKQLQSEIELLKMKILGLTEELDAMRAENEQWRQYAKSEEFISDAEKRLQEWDKKQKADKKLAKSTLYGSLGVLIWASEKEIRDSYAKLLKRYSAKTDDNTLVKLKKLQDAYAILSDSAKRREYNSSIGITDERIAQERAEISDNEKMKIEYREQLESKEFWAKFDELSFNAQTGDAESQNRIGEMYYYGDEVEQDLDQAVYWFKEAAKQKHADAMYNLGVCFVNGEGVEKNKTTGLGFIRQAAKLGSGLALQYTAKASGAHAPANQDT
jgi:TPR repeat protein